LNSSLAQSAAEVWLAKICPVNANHTFCVTLFLSKIEFLSYNLGSSYARKPIKGFKDIDFSLVFQKTSAKKMACWVGAQGQVN